MKKTVIFAICFIMIFAFSSCSLFNAPSSSNTNITFEEFIEETGGIWIVENSISLFSEDEYTYTFKSIGSEYCGGGAYPGGYERAAKISAFKVLEENVYELSLLYEAGDYMDEYLEEATDILVITKLQDGKIEMKYSNAEEIILIYGGNDLDEAQIAAREYANK